MIIIANTLANNGGTTFLLRFAKECNRKGIKLTIVVLYNNIVSKYLFELEKNALVILLFKEYSFLVRKLTNFLPLYFLLRKPSIIKDLEDSSHVHVMGLFGFVFALSFSHPLKKHSISIGVYHQNEFKFNGGSYFFIRWLNSKISKLANLNFIFFNNHNKTSYEKHFNRKWPNSKITSIGIEFKEFQLNRTFNPYNIISVGNLIEFKTYNEHIIRLLPELIVTFQEIKYTIFGSGSNEGFLRKLVSELNLNNYVEFRGVLNYQDFSKEVSNAQLFIGSGTAIIEASILGVPSLVGIESISRPLTTGYFSEVKGFDYNELDETKQLKNINQLIEELFTMEDKRYFELSREHFNKAQEFSISNTVNDFIDIELSTSPIDSVLSFKEKVRLLFSFSVMSFFDILKIDNRFRNRRNQGNIL